MKSKVSEKLFSKWSRVLQNRLIINLHTQVELCWPEVTPVRIGWIKWLTHTYQGPWSRSKQATPIPDAILGEQSPHRDPNDSENIPATLTTLDVCEDEASPTWGRVYHPLDPDRRSIAAEQTHFRAYRHPAPPTLLPSVLSNWSVRHLLCELVSQLEDLVFKPLWGLLQAAHSLGHTPPQRDGTPALLTRRLVWEGLNIQREMTRSSHLTLQTNSSILSWHGGLQEGDSPWTLTSPEMLHHRTHTPPRPARQSQRQSGTGGQGQEETNNTFSLKKLHWNLLRLNKASDKLTI